MIKMFNCFKCSKLDYYCLIYYPEKEDLDNIERKQRNFTNKIKGLQGKNFHESLEVLKLYRFEEKDKSRAKKKCAED